MASQNVVIAVGIGTRCSLMLSVCVSCLANVWVFYYAACSFARPRFASRK